MRANETYRRSSANEAMSYLLRLYSRDGLITSVQHDVKQVGEDAVEVKFSVLSYEKDELWIDGKLIHEEWLIRPID